jgi:hypothetical protein
MVYLTMLAASWPHSSTQRRLLLSIGERFEQVDSGLRM